MQIKYLCAQDITILIGYRACYACEHVPRPFPNTFTSRRQNERKGEIDGEGRRDKEIGTHIHSTSYSAHFIYYFAVAEIVVCFLVFDFYFNSIPWSFLLFICFKLYFPFVVCLKLSC